MWSCCLSQKYIFVLHIPFHKILSFLNSYWKDSYIFTTKIYNAIALMIPNWNRRRVYSRGEVGYKLLIIPSPRGRPHGHNVREVLTGTWDLKACSIATERGSKSIVQIAKWGSEPPLKEMSFQYEQWSPHSLPGVFHIPVGSPAWSPLLEPPQ